MKHFLPILLAVVLTGTCLGMPKREEGAGYQMPTGQFARKFGVGLEAIPRAPKATLAPLPPFPAKMRGSKLNGWSSYALRIDAKGAVKTVDLVAYSREEFGNGRDVLLQWRFDGIAKEGAYLVTLRYTVTPSAAVVTQQL